MFDICHLMYSSFDFIFSLLEQTYPQGLRLYSGFTNQDGLQLLCLNFSKIITDLKSCCDYWHDKRESLTVSILSFKQLTIKRRTVESRQTRRKLLHCLYQMEVLKCKLFKATREGYLVKSLIHRNCFIVLTWHLCRINQTNFTQLSLTAHGKSS